MGATDVAANLHAGPIGQLHVEDGDGRSGSRDPGECVGAVCRLTDHLDLAAQLEEMANAFSDNLVVVQEKDANGLDSNSHGPS